mgnify:CR=1 FL=1
MEIIHDNFLTLSRNHETSKHMKLVWFPLKFEKGICDSRFHRRSNRLPFSR